MYANAIDNHPWGQGVEVPVVGAIKRCIELGLGSCSNGLQGEVNHKEQGAVGPFTISLIIDTE